MNGDSDVRITTLHEQLLKCGKELLSLILESLIRHLRQSHGQKDSGGVLEWKKHITLFDGLVKVMVLQQAED